MNPKLIAKAKTLKSAKEIEELAKKEGISISKEQAEKFFAELHPADKELTDEELNNVSGGSCFCAQTLVQAGYKPVLASSTCPKFEKTFGSGSGICGECHHCWKAKGQELYYCDVLVEKIYWSD